MRVQRNALAVIELPSGDVSGAVRIECGTNTNSGGLQQQQQHWIGIERGENQKENNHHSMNNNKKRARPASSAQQQQQHEAHERKMLQGSLHANMSKLNLNSLRRYRSVYKLNVANDCSKDEFVGAVSKHFQRVKVNESEVISNFLRYLARHGGPAAH